jgi:hypothetical protein
MFYVEKISQKPHKNITRPCLLYMPDTRQNMYYLTLASLGSNSACHGSGRLPLTDASQPPQPYSAFASSGLPSLKKGGEVLRTLSRAALVIFKELVRSKLFTHHDRIYILLFDKIDSGSLFTLLPYFTCYLPGANRGLTHGSTPTDNNRQILVFNTQR